MNRSGLARMLTSKSVYSTWALCVRFALNCREKLLEIQHVVNKKCQTSSCCSTSEKLAHLACVPKGRDPTPYPAVSHGNLTENVPRNSSYPSCFFLAAYPSSLPRSHAQLCSTLELGRDPSTCAYTYTPPQKMFFSISSFIWIMFVLQQPADWDDSSCSSNICCCCCFGVFPRNKYWYLKSHSPRCSSHVVPLILEHTRAI